MKISGLVVGIVIACLCVVGFGVFLSSAAVNYGVKYNNTVSGLDQSAAVLNLSESMSANIQNNTRSSGGFAAIGDLLGYGWNTLRLSFRSLTMMRTMVAVAFNNVSAVIGDNIVIVFESFVVAIIIILVGFAIIEFLAGRKP